MLLLTKVWARLWIAFAGTGLLGQTAMRLAAWGTPPYKGRKGLARMSRKGYISPRAEIYADIKLGKHIFIDDRVTVYQHRGGGGIELGDRVHVHRDTIIEVGPRGSLHIGSDTSVQPRCQFSAFEASILIGRGVQIAPNCAFYPYSHGIAAGQLIKEQPLQTKGGIVVDDDAWLGVAVIVLDGVHIGKGAVIGAGSVVSRDIPDGAIAIGVPARVVKQRSYQERQGEERQGEIADREVRLQSMMASRPQSAFEG